MCAGKVGNQVLEATCGYAVDVLRSRSRDLASGSRLKQVVQVGGAQSV